MSAQESTINCAPVPPVPVRQFWMQCGKNLAQSMVRISCAGCHGNGASESWSVGLNEGLATAAGTQRLASATKHRRMAQSFLLLVLALMPGAARTETIDTEHLFGFTIGSDVGEIGEKEVEGSATGRFSKRTGTFVAGTSTLSVEYVPMPDLRTELTGVVNSYDISGVSGLADQHYTAFGGLGADIRYRLLNRATAPFGLAVGAEPRWGRSDEVTGEPAHQYGVDFVAAADWEVVPNRVVAAFNLLYQPETTRSKLTGTWSQDSTAGVAMAVMAQIRSGIFVGAEARYLRVYDGPGFDNLAGQGFFVGPTIYFKLSQRAWLAVAWSAQVAGHATAAVGSLDLVNFERQQARVLFGINF